VLSACGIRQPENYPSYEPKIAVHKKSDDVSSIQDINSVRGVRKDDPRSNNMMKLPPKPQGNQNNSHNINYKLPPRPMYPGMQAPNQGSNKSFDYDTSRQREKSKENLRNLGAQIVQGKDNVNVNVNMRPPSAASNNRIGRSNSQQKVVYPSWWG